MSGGYTPQQNNWDSASSAFGQVGAMAPWIGGMANANPNQQKQLLNKVGGLAGTGLTQPLYGGAPALTGQNAAGYGTSAPYNPMGYASSPWSQPVMQTGRDASYNTYSNPVGAAGSLWNQFNVGTENWMADMDKRAKVAQANQKGWW